VTLQKYVSHPTLVCLLFSNPTHKTKIGTANWWEITNSKPPGPIKLSSQSTARPKYVLGFAVAFSSLSKLCKYAGPKPLW